MHFQTFPCAYSHSHNAARQVRASAREHGEMRPASTTPASCKSLDRDHSAHAVGTNKSVRAGPSSPDCSMPSWAAQTTPRHKDVAPKTPALRPVLRSTTAAAWPFIGRLEREGAGGMGRLTLTLTLQSGLCPTAVASRTVNNYERSYVQLPNRFTG